MKQYYLSFLALAGSVAVNAQEIPVLSPPSSPQSPDFRNSVQVEVLNESLVSFHYERILVKGKTVSLSARTGLAASIFRDIRVIGEINTLIGRQNHYVEIGVQGADDVVESLGTFLKDFLEIRPAGFVLAPKIGYRFRFPQKRFAVRAAIKPVVYEVKSKQFIRYPAYLPTPILTFVFHF